MLIYLERHTKRVARLKVFKINLKMASAKNKIVKLLKAGIELQALVPVKSIKPGEDGLREVVIRQDTEFGFERHFDKGRIDKGKIDINFGFGKITLRKKDLQEAFSRSPSLFPCNSQSLLSALLPSTA